MHAHAKTGLQEATILIIDDDPNNLAIMTEHLRERKYTILVADSGESGMVRAAYTRPDLILLDVMMPGIDGFETCRRLKSQEKTRDIPVIFMTALAETGHKVKGFEAGGVDYITKPLQREELLARITVHLHNRELTTRLQEANDLLEARVEERTAELARTINALHVEIITREQSENELQSLTIRQNAILSAVPDIILEVDTRKIVRWSNNAGLAFYGEDIVGKEVASFFEGPQNTYEVVQPLFEGTEKIIYVESLQRRKDGEARLLAWRCKALKNQHGMVTGALSTARDITEIKQAEEELRKNESHLRTLVQTIPDLIWLKDKDGVYLSCNSIFERFFGAKEADIIGKTDYDFVDRELADFFLENDRQAIAAGKLSVNEEWVTFADDGNRLLLETIKTPMYNDRGMLIGVLGIGRDITERKRAEEEKVKLEAQLQQSQKMEAVGQLAGGVAHDFNNMLGVILGHAELAMEQIDPTQRIFANLKEISKAAMRSADITRQLLAFARKQTIMPRMLDLNETLEGMLKMLRRLIGEGINLAWLPGANLWPVKVDPSQIDQILANLCVNARDAIKGVGNMIVETGNAILEEESCAVHAGLVSGEYVRIAVSDNGCGMEKETLSHIFEPFFTTKGVGKGTGLGLSTVYGAVKQNNGFVNVYSEPGQGTTFSIYLPRYVGVSDQLERESVEEPPVGGHEIILLVEDEPAIIQMTATMLEHLGYTVLTASTPGEAIHLAEELTGEFHLLLTDVILPEMNGQKLVEKLLPTCPHLKSLFMSGYTSDVIAQHGILDEGIQFIQKPFSKKDLAIKVRLALEKG